MVNIGGQGIRAALAAQAKQGTAERAGTSEKGWMPFENERQYLVLHKFHPITFLKCKLTSQPAGRYPFSVRLFFKTAQFSFVLFALPFDLF